MVTIGILALQGAFDEHEKILIQLGVSTVQIRNRDDWESHQDLDGLVLPGGESTVMGKLLRDLDLFEPIQTAIQAGLPVFGTCAGLILLANQIEGQADSHLATMDMTVSRNAYGRQLGSFRQTTRFEGIGDIPTVFIRGPIISNLGPSGHVLTEIDGAIVAAREKHMLVTAFHPKLTDDTRVHAYFLSMVKEAQETVS